MALSDSNNLSLPGQAPITSRARNRLVLFGLFTAALCLAFFSPLYALGHLAYKKEAHTYILLIPFISGYLIWIKRSEIKGTLHTSIPPILVAFTVGILSLLAGYSNGDPLNRLSMNIFSLYCFLLVGGFAFVGAPIMRQILFPLGFLIFIVPVPVPVSDGIETFLQHTSAEAAYWMLSLTPIPMLRDGVNFTLPGIPIRVAQECSGYNSTFALFLVSSLASYLFLKSPWKRAILLMVIVPLAILRNGFRITVIALLCVYVDRSMIDSFIHRHGGPIFFALSLIPFFLILFWLRKSDAAKYNEPRMLTNEPQVPKVSQ
jgi:exosortase C (VPDSG-CTERM-specific)